MQDVPKKNNSVDGCSMSGSSAEFDTDRENQGEETLCSQFSENSSDHSPSDCASSSISNRSKFNTDGKDGVLIGAEEDSHDICKVVRCIEIDESVKDKKSELVVNGDNDGRISMLRTSPAEDSVDQELLPPPLRRARNTENGFVNGTLDRKTPDVQETSDSLVRPYLNGRQLWDFSADMSSSRSLKLTRSLSCRANIMAGSSSPDHDAVEQTETTPPNGMEKNFPGRPESVRRRHWKIPPLVFGANSTRLSRNDSQSSSGSAFLDELKSENLGDEDIPSIDNFVAGLKEMAKHQYESKMIDQVRMIYLLAASLTQYHLHMKFHTLLILSWKNLFASLTYCNFM